MASVPPIGSGTVQQPTTLETAADNRASVAQTQGRSDTLEAKAIARAALADEVRDKQQNREAFRIRFRDKTRLVTEVLDSQTGNVLYEIPPGLRPLEPFMVTLDDLLEGEPVLEDIPSIREER